MYSREEVNKSSLEYFKGDELAANVFATKYALKSKDGKYLESNPEQMHKRIAAEFARIEAKFGGDNADLFSYPLQVTTSIEVPYASS